LDIILSLKQNMWGWGYRCVCLCLYMCVSISMCLYVNQYVSLWICTYVWLSMCLCEFLYAYETVCVSLYDVVHIKRLKWAIFSLPLCSNFCKYHCVFEGLYMKFCVWVRLIVWFGMLMSVYMCTSDMYDVCVLRVSMCT